MESIATRAKAEETFSTAIGPTVFVRLGAIPTSSAILSEGLACSSMCSLNDASGGADLAVAVACEMLEASVPVAFDVDAAIGRALIKIKRDLFNHRAPRDDNLILARGHLKQDQQHLLDAALTSLDAKKAAESCFVDHHANDLASAKTSALDLMEQEPFLTGLAITAPQMHESLLRYRTSPEKFSTKDRDQLAASAMRYVVRAAHKTSPLATFGPVWPARWSSDQHGQSLIKVPAEVHWSRKVRSAAIERIMRSMLDQWNLVDDTAPIKLNPTVQERDGGGYEWWVRQFESGADKALSGSALERVTSSAPAIRMLAMWLGQSRAGSATKGDLRTQLTQAAGAGAAEKVEAALKSAWSYRVIGPDLPDFRDILDWAETSAAMLVPSKRTTAVEVITAFRQLDFDKGPPSKDLISRYDAQMRKLAACASFENTDVFLPAITVDTTVAVGETGHPPLPERFNRALEGITRLLPALAENSPSYEMRRAMGRFFESRHGTNPGAREELLPFVQAYYAAGGSSVDEILSQDWLPPDDLASDSHGSGNPLFAAVNENGDRSEKSERLNEFIGDLAARSNRPGAQVISQSEFDLVLDQLVTEQDDYLSLQYHLQRFRENGEEKFILNQIFPGACSTLARFLPTDQASVDLHKDYLRNTIRPGRTVEIHAAFGFNANDHPELAEQVVSVPPLPELAGVENLSPDNLYVHLGHGDETLTVCDQTGAPISLLYLAALNPLGLPKQFQALHALSANHLRLEPIGFNVMRRGLRGFDGQKSFSRVALENVVILRHTVIVAADTLPDVDESAAVFYRAFNAWADQQGLPRHLFYQQTSLAKKVNRRSSEKVQPGVAERLYKPMPLDRHCALGVHLFQKLVAKSRGDFMLVESLPAPGDEFYEFQSQPVVAELAVEMTRYRDRDV